METLQRTANRGSISTGPYEIDNSLKFEADNSENLKWTDISTYATSARKKTFSFSAWIKITETGVQRTIWANATNGYLLLQADGQLKWQQSYGGSIKTLNTNRRFRDCGAWYHIIIAVDSTQATEANRVRLYVNGVEETDLTSTTYPSQNAEAENVYENHHYLGAYSGSSIYWCGYMSDVYFISDAQITPSDVGEYDSDSGIWIPKKYTGSISSPSYFLEFKDSSDLGTATSGLDADTLNNIAAADQSVDSPTNNFATINILHNQTSDSTYTEGATYAVNGQSQGWQPYIPTIAVTSGKWYFETQGGGSDMYLMTGMGDEGDLLEWGINQKYYGRSGSKSVAYYGGTGGNGLIYPAQSAPSPAVDYGSSDIIGCAVDIDNGYVYWHKNGTYINSGVPTSGSTGTGGTAIPTGGNSNGTYYLGAATYANSNMKFNYGGYTTISISSAASDSNNYGVFEYAPPTGYYALCTKNLAEYG
tara:strand:+ start:1553 stop:2980 length:1428 start_codon:yes stop_codon:yes gene_type:complete